MHEAGPNAEMLAATEKFTLPAESTRVTTGERLISNETTFPLEYDKFLRSAAQEAVQSVAQNYVLLVNKTKQNNAKKQQNKQ